MQIKRSIARRCMMQVEKPLPVPTQQVSQSQITKLIDMGWVHAQLHPFLKLISLPPGAYGTPYAYFIEGNTCLTC